MVRSGVARGLDAPAVRLRLHTNKALGDAPLAANVQPVELTADQFRVLFSELKAARALMESVL